MYFLQANFSSTTTSRPCNYQGISAPDHCI
jgi:hypothetical protein